MIFSTAKSEALQRDIRETPLYREAEAFYRAVKQPGTGRISDAAEISTNGTHAVFSGTIADVLQGSLPTRICLTEFATRDTRVLTFGPHTDRLPKFSADGKQIAFLSDRRNPGDFQLYLLDPEHGIARSTQTVDGWVEYFHWSPDGSRILLGVAGHGADITGGQGAITSKRTDEGGASWMPSVQTGDESYRWRRAWIYDVAADDVRCVSPSEWNIWEAVWCGNHAFAAVVSPGPGENVWYTANLRVFELATGESRQLYAPQPGNQLGLPAGSPSGTHLAVVEAVCSDRWIVAGDVRLIDTNSGTIRPIDTHGTDIGYTEWRSDQRLLLGGHRGFDSVVLFCDAASGGCTESWSSSEVTSGGRYLTVAGLNDTGDFALIGESFVRAPEVAVIRQGMYQPIISFDVGYSRQVEVIDTIEKVSWKAPDGLEIQGWLLLPKGEAPFPLVMHIHGGPVWQSRPVFLGRTGVVQFMLLEHGYAVFLPNPRGGTGHGQDFARRVVGDMGGADTYDYLSGLDHLVARGFADSNRLGVTGGSYGGFMTSWLITQDARFAAAVPVAPVTNHVTQHLVSNISDFVALFLADTYTNPGGKYFQRSPIMYAANVKTPTLNICGALDTCTPPEEAVQFHNALLENGVTSALVTYPEEGHGVRTFPALFDYGARVVEWFERFMPAASIS